jgi:hypothetical protein
VRGRALLMPEMEIHWPEAASFQFVWLQILAYMGWPFDEAERNARLARYFAEQLASIGAQNKDELSDRASKYYQSARRECWAAFEEFGWFQALLSAPGNSSFPSAEVMTAGRVMLTVRSIEVHHRMLLGGGSVKKAAFLIENADHIDVDHGFIIKNERDIRKAWGKFRGIAHLAASLILTSPSRKNKDDEIEELFLFMLVARDFQRFGTSFYPHARKSTLLDPGEIWSVPKRLPLKLDNGRFPVLCKIFEHRAIVPPLYETDLAALKKYRV